MTDFIIKKERILLAEVVEYTDFDGKMLTQKNLTDIEKYRKVLFMDGHIIDFITGGEIFELKRDPYGYIECSVDANTFYYMELYKYPVVTDNDLLYAASIYEKFMKTQELIKERKLIPFPNKNLYYPPKKRR